MTRTDIINHLIKTYNYSSYLEIGVQDYYANLDKIQIELKHGVDPHPRNKCDFIMTSDIFFTQLDPSVKYDIIFIDGLHVTEQVDRDLSNALSHLSDGGVIVLHDCHPMHEAEQTASFQSGAWTGDVWKTIAKCRIGREDLEVCVVDADCGCGIIRKATSPQTLIKPFELTWSNYDANKKEILNLISVEEFIAKYQ